jgi:hypothetical protein
MKITVCRGTKSKAEEAPNAFFLAERRLPVAAVLNRWTDLPYHFFEVRVDDGRRFVLRSEPPAGRWELVVVYGPAVG